MAQTAGRLITVRGRASSKEDNNAIAEIDAKEFQRARQDPKLQRFAKAADERLGRLREARQID